MEHVFRYRGKNYSQEDIFFIQRLISDNPDDSRRKLSEKLCLAWGWVQKNGSLRDQVCRSLMLELHRAGHISLPSKKCFPTNNLAKRRDPQKIEIDDTPVEGGLPGIKPLTMVEVRRGPCEALCNSLIEHYHYLGYTQPVGEHLKYMVFTGKRPVACMTWSSAPRHIGCRDRYIGWNKSDREGRLWYMAYNSRFLILPWVRVKCLASHIMGMAVRRIAKDWEDRYHHRVYYLETFVDTQRFSGTCYRASNWIYMGDTTGMGKNSRTRKVDRSIKAVYGYPLVKNFREILCGRVPIPG